MIQRVTSLIIACLLITVGSVLAFTGGAQLYWDNGNTQLQNLSGSKALGLNSSGDWQFSGGSVNPAVTASQSLGSSSLKWNGYFADLTVTGTLTASGLAATTPTGNGATDLGSATHQWRALYTAGKIYANEDVVIGTAGKGLSVKEGSDATMGTATLSSGVATVTTAAVDADSRIFVTGQSTTGACYVPSRVNGVSFDIYSTDNSDAGAAAWIIVKPAP